MAIPFGGLVNSGLGLYKQFAGESRPTQFLDNLGRTLLRFDVVLSENFGRQAQPTSFPVEDGSTISDHIIRAPVTYDIVGLITDTPLATADSLKTDRISADPSSSPIAQEVVTTAATSLLPPAAVVAAAGAHALWQSQKNAVSRSRAAYQTLCRMQYGDPTATPAVSPTIFIVETKLETFGNMMIADLQTGRDDKSGDSLTFALKLVRIDIATSQTIPLGALSNQALAALQQSIGEKQGDAFDATKYQQGKIAGRAAGQSGVDKVGL
ncbi:MAG: hypothetical protein EOP64_00295 [Sphingomonas sp.]|nr:MAG: hypothetical protein EOP64_00295 [Sphingomonas sp.]